MMNLYKHCTDFWTFQRTPRPLRPAAAAAREKQLFVHGALFCGGVGYNKNCCALETFVLYCDGNEVLPWHKP